MIRKRIEAAGRARTGGLWDGLLEGRRQMALQAAVFAVGAAFFAVLSVRLGALVGFDMMNYHYYSAYALLTSRFGFDYAPAQIQTFLNPLSFVPPYLLATHFSPLVSGLVMGGIHGLAFGLVFVTAWVLFSGMGALARLTLSLSCAAVGTYGPVFISTLGSSHNDNFVSLFALAAVYVLVRGVVRFDVTDVRRWTKMVLIGGLLLGVATGLKLSFAVYVVGSGVAVLVFGRGWRSRLAAAGVFGAASVLGLLLSRGFWMADLWSRFGSPLFPFYNKIFRSPYFYDRNLADNRYLPETFGGALQLPFHFMMKTHFTTLSHHFRDGRYALVYVLVLLCLVVLLYQHLRTRNGPPPGRHSRAGARAGAFLVIFFAVSYVVWQAKFATIRYAVPLELLAPIVIAVLVRWMLTKPYLCWPAIVAAFITVAATTQPLELERGPWHSEYFNIDPPQFDKPEQTLVILANDQPWSFVIPFFQPEVRFVGMWSTYSSRPAEGERHRGTEEMLALVRAHRGPVYLLSYFGGLREESLRHLAPYDISASGECIPLAPFSAAHPAQARRRAVAAGELPAPVRLCLFPAIVAR